MVAYGQAQKADEKAQIQLEKRIIAQQQLAQKLDVAQWPQAPLMPFEGVAGLAGSAVTEVIPHNNEDKKTGLPRMPFALKSYIQLVQETGQLCRPNKKGCLSKASEAVLAGLGLNTNCWLEHVLGFERFYGQSVGGANRLFGQARARDRAWVKGLGAAGRLYEDYQ